MNASVEHASRHMYVLLACAHVKQLAGIGLRREVVEASM